MPGGDGTGPVGMGPMTGRAGGFCAGSGRPGYAKPAPGRGLGMGFGRGRGFGNGRGWRHRQYGAGWTRGGADAVSFQPPDAETEKHSLKAQADDLQAQLDALRKRLGEIEDKAR
jgi:hypothetical protein